VRISPWWRRYRAKQFREQMQEHGRRQAAAAEQRIAETQRQNLWGGAVPKSSRKDAYYTGDGELHR